MRKVVIDRPGSYDRLRLVSVPEPIPGPGQVLIRTHAIGVNYADCVVRMGLYSAAKKFAGWPITPGFEVAGEVTAVGAEVKNVAPGAQVMAVMRFDAYASHVLVPCNQVFPIPEAFSMEQAAAFPAVFLTAHYALFTLGDVSAGSRVLVHSAAGGVGGALLQLARIAGAHSVGVVGNTTKVATATYLGADIVIDKSRQDLWALARKHAPGGYDVIFDANGPSTLGDSYRHLAAPGRLVVYGFHGMLPRSKGKPNWPRLVRDWALTPRFNPLDLVTENRAVMGFNLSYLYDHKSLIIDAMNRLLGWVEAGRLVSPPIRTFPLEDVAEAHRAMESGESVGKIVLIP